MQHIPHTRRRRIRQHHKAQVSRRLVKVQLVLSRAVADKGVVVAAELARHVAQRKDGAKDELCVVGRCRGRPRVVLVAGWWWLCGAAGAWAGDGWREPGFCVDAFR